MLVYALSANGKVWWKMTQDPRKNPDRQQNQTDWSLGHAPSLQKFHQNPFTTFRNVLLTKMITQRDGHKRARTNTYTDQLHNQRRRLIIKKWTRLTIKPAACFGHTQSVSILFKRRWYYKVEDIKFKFRRWKTLKIASFNSRAYRTIKKCNCYAACNLSMTY